MIRRLLSVALLLVATLLTVPSAHAEWKRADSDHFIIYSDGSQSDLRALAIKLERFDAALRMVFSIPDNPNERRLPIYLLLNANEVSRLVGAKGGFIAGFYRPDAEGTFAVSNREKPDARDPYAKLRLSADTVLLHEYAHHFMFHNLPRATPAWYVEGFAEFFATIEFNDAGAPEVGRPALHRAYGLTELQSVPVRTILTGMPRDATSAMREVYYGRSWLLTHMLSVSPTRGKQLTAYLDAVAGGVDLETAATTHFGDLDVLDKELNAYMNAPIRHRVLPPVPTPANIAITTLSDAEGALILPMLRRRRAQGDEARVESRDKLAALAEKYPGSADIWYEYAKAEWDRKPDIRDLALVQMAVGRALAINPDHPKANVVKSWWLANAADDAEDATAAMWRDSREPLLRANRADPGDPVPLFEWYRNFRRQGAKPPAAARDGLAQAFALSPEVTDFRAGYAMDLVAQGEFDRAIALIKVIAFSPHDGGEGEKLLREIEAMRDKANGTALPDKDEIEAASE
jgi:hypothetical protein